MTVLCLGISHTTAPLSVRERLAYDATALEMALTRATAKRADARWPLAELAILSTCHRVELYAVARDADDDADRSFAALADFLAETRDVDRAQFQSYAERLSGVDAVAHLCSVAAGLCSVVLGESEVLGQVDRAHEAAERVGAAGPVLSMLFRTAVRAGRRARAETEIGRNPASIGSIAVELAERLAPDLRGHNVLVVGAGKMGARAAAALGVRGDWQITVVNRTYHRAQELAGASNGRGMSVELLREGIAWADVVITSTGAPHTIIGPALVHDAMAGRPERPLICIDIAVPRDVDPAVRAVSGVRLFDIDDLRDRAECGMAERRAEIPRVEQIVREQTAAFERWRRSTAFEPLLRELRQHAEAIRRRELERVLQRLPMLDDAAREQVEHLSQSLMNRLLHEPTRRLRHEGSNGAAESYARMARELFGLERETRNEEVR
jgi:glutamyl-tRNA reductase